MGGIARSRVGVGISSHQGNRRFTNRRQFNSEMRKQDHLGAFPLVQSSRNLIGLELPLAEIGYRIDDYPGYTTAKIDDLDAAGQSLLVKQRKRSTSCNKKLINPVAMIGFPIQTYQAAHCCSSQFRDWRSVSA